MISLDRFHAYLESVRNKPFEWGKHDCLTFANESVKALRYAGFADDWLGNYSTERGAALHALKMLRKHMFSGIIEAVDSRLFRCESKIPPRGSVVARPCEGVLGYAFGVVVSDRCAFVGSVGLDILKIETSDLFWRT